MKPDKPFKTYDEQIQILKSRHVIIVPYFLKYDNNNNSSAKFIKIKHKKNRDDR